MHFANNGDWDRFEAAERGEDVALIPEVPDWKIWQDEMRIAELVEELGFDSLWATEHHFTPYQMIPNPLQLMTYMAGRTERVDFGTMVTVLPWHEPVRLAEQVGLLQDLIGERRAVRLGVGRGAAIREFDAFRVDMDESRGRFQEVLDVLRLALTQPRFSYRGEYIQIPETGLRPLPKHGQMIVDNMLGAWGGSPESVVITAKSGLKPFVIPQKPIDDYISEFAEYARVRAETGLPPERPTIVFWVYCAETFAEAERGANLYLRAYTNSALRHYQFANTHFDKLKTYAVYKEASRALREKGEDWMSFLVTDHLWGTPDQLIERGRELVEQTDCEEMILHLAYGGMPLDLAEKSMRLFAREVMPALRETPVAAASGDRRA
jgi:alkanesulfonate monooxygenase SsuD/methylene tetrahydromethanopterin reductase-like flavin-dependent oxidoreductase (luciferase family)